MAVDYSTTQPVGASRTATATAASGSGSKADVDYQSFLKLLVAEMKNQDPTKPMDSTQFVAQLASFSQVEQSVQINSRLDQILQTSAMSQADSLIGRTITSADGKATGVVNEVRLFKDGVAAILEDGRQIPVLPGVTIKATPA